jgi:integrase
MVGKAGTDIKGLRDRALLLLGFAGAFRRSELVALDVADLQFCDSGLRAIIRKSKTDQEGQGATIAIARGSVACPVDAVRAWIKAAGFLMVLYSALLRGRERSRLVGCQPEPSPSS